MSDHSSTSSGRRLRRFTAQCGVTFQSAQGPARRSGFTLLELFLTLALAVVLMTLVNAAFRFYVGQMDSSDMEMRRTLLAGAVMQMIEDDLRATLHPEPLDTAALEELLSKTAAAATGGGGGGGGGASGGDSGATDTSSDTSEEDSASTSESLAVGIATLDTPGVIGNQYQLQIDTSRLPRLEEYAVMMDADPATMTDPPSDLKTVTYFVQEAGAVGIRDELASVGGVSGADVSTGGGLVRRVLDRSAQNFATTSGSVSTLNQTGEVLAPEITAIEFSYWDGLTWQIEWNSDTMGELPLAIKIQMAMTDPNADPNTQEPRLFQHIVRLPMAKLIEMEDETTTEESI